MTIDTLQILIAVLLGTGSGSIAGLVVAVTTIRYERRKRAAEAKEAEQKAKSSELHSDEKTLQIFKQYIYEAIQKEVTSLSWAINRCTRAVDKINDCPHAANCPVRHELQISQDKYDTADANAIA